MTNRLNVVANHQEDGQQGENVALDFLPMSYMGKFVVTVRRGLVDFGLGKF